MYHSNIPCSLCHSNIQKCQVLWWIWRMRMMVLKWLWNDSIRFVCNRTYTIRISNLHSCWRTWLMFQLHFSLLLLLSGKQDLKTILLKTFEKFFVSSGSNCKCQMVTKSLPKFSINQKSHSIYTNLLERHNNRYWFILLQKLLGGTEVL